MKEIIYGKKSNNFVKYIDYKVIKKKFSTCFMINFRILMSRLVKHPINLKLMNIFQKIVNKEVKAEIRYVRIIKKAHFFILLKLFQTIIQILSINHSKKE